MRGICLVRYFPTIRLSIKRNHNLLFMIFLLVDLHELSKQTGVDVSHLPIRNLVQSTIAGGRVHPVVTFFGLSPKAKVMISSLSKLGDSVLLRQFWKDNGDKVLKLKADKEGRKVFLTVDDVEEFVWTPSNDQLRSLQERFLSGAISFEEIDKFFKVFKNNVVIAEEMKLIASRYGTETKAIELLVNQRIKEMEQYYKLHNCIDAAKSIFEFKTFLGLQGNFRLVEDLQNQVCLSFKYLHFWYVPVPF